MEPLLELRDLRTHFRSGGRTVTAVDGVSYTVDPAETVGVVGESGCGKSATALSIMGLLPKGVGRVVGGEILFEGRDLVRASPDEMRRIRGGRMAMIFQEPMTSLNPVLKIGRQLTEPMEIHLGTSRSAARARAVELLDMVQISDAKRHLGEYPHQLSGGMRQRVMLAMALACRPKLILADEPTTALDVTVQAQVLDLMKQLSTELGVAMLLITHNLGLVARYADRVVVMYAGKVVESGTTAELFADPRHPYTRALLRSVPRLDVPTETLVTIGGQPPDLADLPPGCSFRPRCASAVDRCAVEAPPLVPTGSHEWSCWATGPVLEEAS